MATKDRGFASMDPEKQRQIASKGGKASHKNQSTKTNRSNSSRKNNQKSSR